ncbi:hypothetical protein RJ527_08890 [Thalassospiraceae bacterium LMO-SO8]|nr:hypothetical protein [Alphaproteobacteria bacterium LMO-S08]WND77847.1 hypothetical protein RJ527_08890 [Thalassospiraceae bacterium LMO-SO8]
MSEFERAAALPPAPKTYDAAGSGDAGLDASPTGPDEMKTGLQNGLAGVGGTDGFGGFGRSFLTDAVGRGQSNTPEDVFQASSFLAANGLLPAATRNADEDFLRGIEQGQKHLNGLAGGGLSVDGIARPWGPTEILSQRAISSGRMKMPAAEPAPLSISATSVGTPSPPKPVPSLLAAAPEDRPSAAPQIAASGTKDIRQPAMSRSSGIGPTPLGAPAAGPAITPPPVPLYRKQVIKGQKDEWPKQHDAFTRLPGLSGSEHRAYMEIFAAEGGGNVNPSNGATAGITRTTLNDLIDRGKVTGIPKGTEPKSLDKNERAQVYRAYFDDALGTVGGSAALRGVGDPETAAAFGDTLFRHGSKGGTEIVQRALNAAGTAPVAVDGAMGPATYSALRRAAGDPAMRARFLNSLADERKQAVRHEATGRNEHARFDHFRFQKAP